MTPVSISQTPIQHVKESKDQASRRTLGSQFLLYGINAIFIVLRLLLVPAML